ncbi:expressed unknown protein [Seminavis robusta]|uniref:CRAL-TRIO domain-containing protein n=1 Tax=Seminavis robusta TaxID=568900 RepID=A0A9N8E130_9STRA|nr:expressed unknown protein [Seminavis robusta]|eukprot:Sro542_g163390.1 n/a (312) ;mRNA; r:41156-42091
MNMERDGAEAVRAREDHAEDEDHDDEAPRNNGAVAGAGAAIPAGIMNPELLEDGDQMMEISDQEKLWARAIKAAIESCPDLEKLSDFEYCQLAIIDQGNMEAAVDRATSLQGFRQEYDVKDTLEDALTALRQLVSVMPSLFLSFTCNHSSGGYVTIADMAAYDLQALKTEKGWKTHMLGHFYLFGAMCTDFRSIRTGINFVVECDGFSWTSNMDFVISKNLCRDFYSIYPYRAQQLSYFHTNLFLNMTIAACRAVLPKSIASKFQVGCIFPGGRLDQFYLIPDQHTAAERTIHRMQESIRRRYAMVASYKL